MRAKRSATGQTATARPTAAAAAAATGDDDNHQRILMPLGSSVDPAQPEGTLPMIIFISEAGSP